MSSQFSLLKQRRFLPFFLTQFLGAFNDNVFKTALITLVSFRAAQLAGLDSKALATLLPGLFILPFFLFSATSGQIADKHDKSRVMRGVKLLEIAIMLLAAWGFVTHHLWALVIALFLMGLQSTVFGPAKYSYLPQHMRDTELVGANGLVEMGTFIAILLGQILGVAMIASSDNGWPVALAVLVLALAGWLTSLAIPASPPADPTITVNWNPVTETIRNIGFARSSRAVWLSVLGISWFWFYGATLLAQFPIFAREVLGGTEATFILLLGTFSVGIGVGSLLCEKLSQGRLEVGLVPFGAIGLTLFGVDLYFAIPDAPLAGAATLSGFLAHAAHWRILADIALIGLFGGFYIVPLYAMLQTRSERSHQSRIIAANNIINAAFMVVSAGVSLGLFALGLNIPELFLATALFNAVVAIYIYTLLPEFLMRFIVWIVMNCIYRMRRRGIAHIPHEGAAVIVCNHVSYVDALLILACSPRPIRFVMHHRIFRIPILNFVFRENRAIPIASGKEDAELLSAAYDEIAAALAAGELVGIFPEGGITEDGEIAPFRNGIAKIVARTPVPVVPMALRGLWGSFFSRKGGAAMTRPLRRGFFNRVDLVVDAAIPAEAVTPQLLQQRVAALRGDLR